MNQTKYGVISDVHNDPRVVRLAVEVLMKEGAEKLLVNGDIGDRQPTLQKSQDYIAVILDAVGKSGLESYVHPGSHETIYAYKPVIDFFTDKYPNIIDAVENSYFVLHGHNLAFIPGSDWVSGGEFRIGTEFNSGIYIVTEQGPIEMESFEQYESMVRNRTAGGIFYYKNMNDIKDDVTDPEKTIIVCHIPRKFNNLETAVDMAEFGEATEDFNLNNKPVEKGSVIPMPFAKKVVGAGAPVILKRENRGNEDLKKLYEELRITKAVTGHFHESGHRANDSAGNFVKEGEFTNNLFWNSGWLDAGQTGILNVRENKVCYQNIRLQDYLNH
jgi:Icc-related predicted phosphoesterase